MTRTPRWRALASSAGCRAVCRVCPPGTLLASWSLLAPLQLCCTLCLRQLRRRFQDRSVFLITCYVTISDVSRAEGSLVDVRGRWAGPERWQAIFGWLPAKAALRCSQLQGNRCSSVDFRAADPSIASTSGVSCKGTRPLRVRWGGEQARASALVGTQDTSWQQDWRAMLSDQAVAGCLVCGERMGSGRGRGRCEVHVAVFWLASSLPFTCAVASIEPN